MAVGHRGSLPPLMGQWMPSPALPDFQSGHSGPVATGPEQVPQRGFFSTCFSLLFTLNAGKAMGRDRVGNWGFLGDSAGKESACKSGDWGLIPGLGRSPGVGNGNPTPVFLPGESHGQRSLEEYSPCGCKS